MKNLTKFCGAPTGPPPFGLRALCSPSEGSKIPFQKPILEKMKKGNLFWNSNPMQFALAVSDWNSAQRSNSFKCASYSWSCSS